MQTSFTRTIYISKESLRKINEYLTLEPTSVSECLSEDETISYSADFDNGYEMDIKCCGVQYDPDEPSNLAWSEAVLFHNGSEVCRTEPVDLFEGDWELSDGDKLFTVHVVPSTTIDVDRRVINKIITETFRDGYYDLGVNYQNVEFIDSQYIFECLRKATGRFILTIEDGSYLFMSFIHKNRYLYLDQNILKKVILDKKDIRSILNSQLFNKQLKESFGDECSHVVHLIETWSTVGMEVQDYIDCVLPGSLIPYSQVVDMLILAYNNYVKESSSSDTDNWAKSMRLGITMESNRMYLRLIKDTFYYNKLEDCILAKKLES